MGLYVGRNDQEVLPRDPDPEYTPTHWLNKLLSGTKEPLYFIYPH